MKCMSCTRPVEGSSLQLLGGVELGVVQGRHVEGLKWYKKITVDPPWL